MEHPIIHFSFIVLTFLFAWFGFVRPLQKEKAKLQAELSRLTDRNAKGQYTKSEGE